MVQKLYIYEVFQQTKCLLRFSLEIFKLKFLIIMAVTCSVSISYASGKPLLIENDKIWSELLEISVANKITEECESIDARKIKGLFALLAIKNEAAQLGYTEVEIKEFIGNKENQEKLENDTDIYLTNNGVDLNKGATFCKFGRLEINKESIIGSLLRTK